MDSFNWSPEYLDNMRLWEIDTYVELLEQRLEKEEKARKKQGE